MIDLKADFLIKVIQLAELKIVLFRVFHVAAYSAVNNVKTGSGFPKSSEIPRDAVRNVEACELVVKVFSAFLKSFIFKGFDPFKNKE